MDITKDLPEECISKIISFTSPKDAGRSSLVHSAFRAAADSDAVWETFLPSDYKDIISESSSPHLNSLSKKTLFFHLSIHPLLSANNNMSLALDKQSGKKCYMIGAKGLTIIRGDAPEYWKWTSIPKCRFPLVTELNFVCWLEVKGSIETKLLSPNTTYAVFVVFKFGRIKQGFKNRHVGLWVNFEGSENDSKKRVILDTPRNEPQPRMDGWMEVEVGEFFNEHGVDGSVVCKLFEFDGKAAMAGLLVEGVEIRPKRSR